MRRLRSLVSYGSSLAAFALASAGLTQACSGPNPEEFSEAAAQSEALARGNGAKQGNGPNLVADAGTSPGLPPPLSIGDAGVVMCGNAACACNNGLDDDGDGVSDGFDVECTGALDDDESSFATGIPGDNRDPKWQDCFFDGNSGHGDDRCRYATGCLTGELPLTDPDCAVAVACRDNCAPRAPNGCDCFGCCTVQLKGRDPINILLQDSCSLEKVGDPEACPVCVPSSECANPCGECELCPGKTPADLPAHCQGTPPAEPPSGTPDAGPPGNPPPYSCEDGVSCYSPLDCPSNQFCSMGCCIPIIQ
jgi:hypothetical protein